MRYLPLTPDDRQAMLAKIGVRHIDDLFKDVPNAVLNPEIDLPRHKAEMEVERHLSRMAAKNTALAACRSSLVLAPTSTMCPRRLIT
nr:hypothetical protein [Kordiimonas gwangyangensis]